MGFSLIAARGMPLEWVARAYTLGALGVLLVTVYLAVICECLATLRTRLLAAAIVMFTPAIEVWLTLLDAQFYLPVCVGLICISSEHRHRTIRCATLALAGLTGPVSCVLTPFFLWRAWVKKSTVAWLQATILTACSFLQGTILLHSLKTGVRKVDFTAKAEWFGPIVFAKVFAVSLFSRVGAFVAQHVLAIHPNLMVCATMWLLTFGGLWLFWHVARAGGYAARVLFTMAVVSLVFNYAGDPAPAKVIFTGEFRYFFTGMALFWMSLLLGFAGASESKQRPAVRLAAWVLTLALVSGLADAVGYWTRFQRVAPDWSEQVAVWRRDPATPLRVPPLDWGDRLRLTPR